MEERKDLIPGVLKEVRPREANALELKRQLQLKPICSLLNLAPHRSASWIRSHLMDALQEDPQADLTRVWWQAVAEARKKGLPVLKDAINATVEMAKARGHDEIVIQEDAKVGSAPVASQNLITIGPVMPIAGWEPSVALSDVMIGDSS